MRVYLYIAFLFVAFSGYSQSGNYFLSHFSPPDERIDYRSAGMTQDEKGVIYFTNKKGVLEFDGKNWRILPTPGAVYTVIVYNHELYAGGLFGFGKLNKNKDTKLTYQSLSNIPNIFSSIAVADKIYICSEKKIFVYSPALGKIEKEIKAEDQNSFSGLFQIGANVYVNTDTGISKIENGKIIASGLNVSSLIAFSSHLAKSNQAVIGTDDGRIFRVDADHLTEIKLKDEFYLQRNLLITGAWLREDLIALGTLKGGVIFINPLTGATEEITNYYTGLPDNEVFALLADRNEGVWVAHEYGFTRIAPYIPFRSYKHYPGLAGNLLCAKSFRGQVYVGTTLGLYNLGREDVYEDAVIYSAGSPQIVDTDSKGKRGLFGFLRKKKKPETPVPIQSQTSRRIVRVLKSIQYAYRKVDGIEGKVTQLTEVNGKLLASGTNGVSDVEGLHSKSLIQEPVRNIFLSPSLKQLLVSTYDESIKTYLPGTPWKETHVLDTLKDYISYMFEDNVQNLWLCGRTKIYKAEVVEGEIGEITAMPIENFSLDETVGLAYGSQVYVAASGEFKRYNGKGFVKYDSLPGPHRYFASAGYFWFNDGHKWRTVDPKMRSLKLEWLGLFPNLRFLTPDESGQNLWVITASNELYKFSNQKLQEDVSYPLFLREIRGQKINLVREKSVKIDQADNALSFEFIQPNYVSLQNMEYRYQVKGLTNTWSTWSNANNIINFSYLPAGNYQLAVQSKDLLGTESKIELISFEVFPPYWKRWWFYATEVVFFSSLVLLSVKLSSADSKYRYLSQILTLLTVIMFIQFIQTAINSFFEFKSSPVIDFFIQVSIALLVFPIEAYLRKFMQHAAEGKYQIKLNRNKGEL